MTHCNFCHATEDQVAMLIAPEDGLPRTALICEACVARCARTVREHKAHLREVK